MASQLGKVSVLNVVLGLLVVLGVFYIVGMEYTNVPESRKAGSDLWSRTEDLRSHVEGNAKKTSKLEGAGVGVKSPVALDTQFGRVDMSIDANGRIIARNAKFNLEAVISPSLRGGVVDWQCKGTPPKDMSTWCR